MKSLLLVPMLLLALSQCATAQTKLAFVVGVERYEKSGLKNLDYAEDDARQVQDALKKLGFSVLPVIGDEASLANLNKSLDRFIAQTQKLGKADIVIVYFSGHGVQKLVKRKNADGKLIEVEEPFFCPKDALKSDPTTLLSMNTVLERLERSSGCDQNIIMLDACRESADKSGKGGIDGSNIRELSEKISLYFAAKSGRRSFESKELKHGIFTHYLLEGLSGKAADSDNEITFQGLASFVTKQVERNSPRLLDISVEEAQRPNLILNSPGTIVLGRVDGTKQPPSPPSNKSNTAKTFQSRSTGLDMVLIPGGTFLMGSPDGEDKTGKDETQHSVSITRDFCLGKYEVTQKEFEQVMGFNPSNFTESKRLPVEQVSWFDAVMFCNKLSELDGYEACYRINNIEKEGDSIKSAQVDLIEGARGYRLPTESEWEYACRGGAKEYSAFSFGSTITPTQVNYDGDYPYGNGAKGLDRKKTLEVGKLPSNGFGLCEMHGNVIEWCWDCYGEYPSGSVSDPKGATSGWIRVRRGGSWDCNASNCRSANRSWNLPDNRDSDLGFRVALVPQDK